jgi:hypothetical protein
MKHQRGQQKKKKSNVSNHEKAGRQVLNQYLHLGAGVSKCSQVGGEITVIALSLSPCSGLMHRMRLGSSLCCGRGQLTIAASMGMFSAFLSFLHIVLVEVLSLPKAGCFLQQANCNFNLILDLEAPDHLFFIPSFHILR